jgi:hypothetical protein
MRRADDQVAVFRLDRRHPENKLLPSLRKIDC